MYRHIHYCCRDCPLSIIHVHVAGQILLNMHIAASFGLGKKTTCTCTIIQKKNASDAHKYKINVHVQYKNECFSHAGRGKVHLAKWWCNLCSIALLNWIHNMYRHVHELNYLLVVQNQSYMYVHHNTTPKGVNYCN